MVEELQVPIHLKMTLTIKEAAAYSNIEINKIDKKLVKRREFEEYISQKLVI